jgi:inosine-uridine nucleoside N-ribohydrolase
MKKMIQWASVALRPLLLSTVFCGALASLTSCSEAESRQRHEYTGVPLIILDTDIGSSTDDLFSLMMLYGYESLNKCRLLGVVVDREGVDCAACADVMDSYYGYGDVPIGLVRDGIKNPKVWIDYRGLPSHCDSNGNLMFQRSVADYSTLPNGWQLYRRLLAAQPDHSVSIVSIGFVTCLAQLLQSLPDCYSSLDGVELVRRKVKCLYLMGGVFGESEEPDFNLSQGIGFAKTFFQLWPRDVDIVFSPMEVGQEIEYTPEQVINDIDWTDVAPIKQIYMTYNCRTGQKMWDPLLVINAVEGDSLFTLSPRGTVTFTNGGGTLFSPSPAGNIRYQLPGDAAWNAAMLERIRTFCVSTSKNSTAIQLKKRSNNINNQ